MTNETDNLSAADRDKIMRATAGTKFGSILRCAYRCYEGVEHPKQGPAFVGHATVTSDRFVMCDFIVREDEQHMGAFVGSVADLDDNITKLSAHLSFNNAQRNALAALVTGWIATDYPSHAAKVTIPTAQKVETEIDAVIRRLETALRDVGTINAKLEEQRAALLTAAKGLGAMPEGYCFCSRDRIGDNSKQHEPECRDLRAAIIKAGG